MRRSSKRRVVWSPEAEHDLFEIWEFVAETTGRAPADRLLCEIHATSEALRAWPELGTARDDVREGLRARRADHYVVFYRVGKKGAEIVRVLHERRDIENVFVDDAA